MLVRVYLTKNSLTVVLIVSNKMDSLEGGGDDIVKESEVNDLFALS